MKKDTPPLERILYLAEIKPFNYTKVGKLCFKAGAEDLLTELFGGKVTERFFKLKKKRPLALEP
jgi:hypothetical protein